MESNEIIVWTLEQYEELLAQLLDYLLLAAVKLEEQIQKVHKTIYSMKTHPSLLQYANRFIEFFEGPFIGEAYKRLEVLVRSGISPDHAFRMIVHSDK